MEPLDEEARTLVKQVNEACSIRGRDRAHFLGPFARRVSFVAQQNRALNLVYVLRYLKEVQPGHHVAVIGAGLAGLMSASALVALGCKVDLYERAAVILPRQRNAHHRLVHPTVNYWPDLTDLCPTTELPFYDWYSDTCVKVMRDFEDEWEKHFAPKLRAWDGFVFGAEVQDLVHVDGGVYVATTGDTKSTRYDRVIVAVGFEDERVIAGIDGRSYWRQDDIEGFRLDVNAKFLISGTGDGGLIDALRAVHLKFEEGKLPVRVATDLSRYDAALGEHIKAAELACAKLGDRDERAYKLADRYRSLVEPLTAAAAGAPIGSFGNLETSLLRRPKLVTLVGEDATAYGRDAAPIHKLLVAHAESVGAIKYVRGEVKIGPTGGQILQVGPHSEPIPPRYVVIRHGAKNALYALLKNIAEVDELKRTQEALIDHLAMPLWRRLVAADPSTYPSYNIGTDAFSVARYARASKLLNDLPDEIRHKLKFAVRAGGLGYVLESEIPFTAWVPKALFGINLAVAEPPTVPAHSGRKGRQKNTNRLQGAARISSSSKRHFGTLGALVANAAGEIFGLAASHSLIDGHQSAVLWDDRPIGHTRDELRAIDGSRPLSEGIALVRISRDVEIASRCGSLARKKEPVAIKDVLGIRVKKIGAQGPSWGRVTAIFGSVRFTYVTGHPPALFHDAIEIEPDEQGTEFSAPGDSGALVVGADGSAIGLVMGGASGRFFVAPLAPVFAQHGFRFLSTSDVSIQNRQARELHKPLKAVLFGAKQKSVGLFMNSFGAKSTEQSSLIALIVTRKKEFFDSITSDADGDSR